MTATHMPTPCGMVPIREPVRQELSQMTDREVADKALKSGPFIDPEAYAELLHRGLSAPGWFHDDTYKEIERRESA